MPETVRDIYHEPLTRKLKSLVAELPQSGYLVAERFTVADILAAYSLRLAISAGLLELEQVSGYLTPLMDRPAAQASEFFSSLG